ncbi:RNA polymerase II subunit B1 CTD phosphatase Rpap2 [Holothuria leucospilota]|uniref:RNA polymerase II subunit B1 CTD phosphatase RPAP2 homolog n=1 Tax=Holothuria leucospilota TaxID=206669 RepID=A0A9Q1H868_HOLLE|nr:RNA polymerase II subunit B1 CTD phosphatase Rpap2 [Holothuria leucospilota]
MDAKGKDYEKRRKEVEEYVQEQFEAQKKAVQIVERLTDVPVDEDFFRNCAKFILPSHYTDATEERSILKNCGYPLCEKKLGKIPPQKYHISTKKNKIYDITERKVWFCSQFCYRASKYYQAQIPTSPLWSRSKEKFDEIKLLEVNSKLPFQEEAPNDMIVRLRIKPEEIENPSEGKEKVDMDNMDDVIDDMSILSLYDSKSQRRRYNEFEKKEGKQDNKPSLGIESDSLKDVGEGESTLDYKHSQQEEEKGRESKGNVDMKSFHETEEQNRSNRKNIDGNHYKTNSSNLSQDVLSQSASVRGSRSQGGGYVLFAHVRQCLLEWVTAESKNFLNSVEASGQSHCNKMESEMSHDKINKESTSLGQDFKLDEGREEEVVVASLNPSLEEDSRNEGGVVSFAASKPLPNIEQLRGDTELFSLKVTQFYSLRPDKVHPSVAEKEKMIKQSGEKKEEEHSGNVVLPPVDSKSQMVIRRKILLDKVHKILKDLLPPLSLSLQDISSDLRDLVKTFDLSSHNISFKPAGWTLVSLCLLHLMRSNGFLCKI